MLLFLSDFIGENRNYAYAEISGKFENKEPALCDVHKLFVCIKDKLRLIDIKTFYNHYPNPRALHLFSFDFW